MPEGARCPSQKRGKREEEGRFERRIGRSERSVPEWNVVLSGLLGFSLRRYGKNDMVPNPNWRQNKTSRLPPHVAMLTTLHERLRAQPSARSFEHQNGAFSTPGGQAGAISLSSISLTD